MQRKVLALYYFEDMRLREIAEVFGLTESRICQIHAQAILNVKAYLHNGKPAAEKLVPPHDHLIASDHRHGSQSGRFHHGRRCHRRLWHISEFVIIGEPPSGPSSSCRPRK